MIRRESFFSIYSDLNLNRNEYLIFDRIITKTQLKKLENLFKSVERICDVRIFTCEHRLKFNWLTKKFVVLVLQNSSMAFFYIVGAKSQQELVRVSSNDIVFQSESIKYLSILWASPIISRTKTSKKKRIIRESC